MGEVWTFSETTQSGLNLRYSHEGRETISFGSSYWVVQKILGSQEIGIPLYIENDPKQDVSLTC